MDTPPSRATRLDSVDLLRGVAALAVVIDHVGDVIERLGSRVAPSSLAAMPAANDLGASGVDLFFVISGFVMAHVIADPRGAPSSAQFLHHRAVRILPLFLIASTFYSALLVYLGDLPTVAAMLNTFTLLPLVEGVEYTAPPLFVGWTLAFEAGFYLLVMCVLSGGIRRRRLSLLIITAGVAAAGMIVHLPWSAARTVCNPIMFEFALGVAAHLLWQRGFFGSPALRVLIGLLSLAIVVEVVHPVHFALSVHFTHVVNGQSGLWRTLVWGVPWMLILLGTLGLQGDGGPMRRAMRVVGAASFSLYLSHPFVMMIAGLVDLGAYRPDAIGLAVILVSMSLALGILVHRHVEQPLLQFLRRSTPRDTPGRVLSASPLS